MWLCADTSHVIRHVATPGQLTLRLGVIVFSGEDVDLSSVGQIFVLDHSYEYNFLFINANSLVYVQCIVSL